MRVYPRKGDLCFLLFIVVWIMSEYWRSVHSCWRKSCTGSISIIHWVHMTCVSHFITLCDFNVYKLRPWLWKKFCLCLILRIWSVSLDSASQLIYMKGNTYLQSQGSWDDKACMFLHSHSYAIKCLLLHLLLPSA